MKPVFDNGNVKANCPDCGALTTFEFMHGGNEFGAIQHRAQKTIGSRACHTKIYHLLRCAGCGRAGLAEVYVHDNYEHGILDKFYPFSIDSAQIPQGVPEQIVKEFREAELCMSFNALRAASALFRSVLEKVLKENGYVRQRNLEDRIDAASEDGIITESRKKRAHEEVRTLGNDILHDEWRPVAYEEVEAAHHYAQRILEDFYDDRASVEGILASKGKLNHGAK